jgi:diguanylate cyclase (GGDEF)-like protein/PAS domain S-box-containing protein
MENETRQTPDAAEKPADLSQEAAVRRAAMVKALNSAIDIFMSYSEESFDSIMASGVWPIAFVADLDRICIYRLWQQGIDLHKRRRVYSFGGRAFYRSLELNPKMNLSQVYRWDREIGGTKTISEKERHLQHDPMTKRWVKVLSGGNQVLCRDSTADEDEKKMLQQHGIKSLMIVPIFTRGDFWGFVTLQDHTSDRHFDEGYTDLLFSAARLMANIYIRAEIERDLAETNKLNRVMFNNAPVGLTTFDEKLNIVDCNDAVLSMYGVGKQYYLDNFFSLSPDTQPDGSASKARIKEIIGRAMNGERIVCEWVHSTPEGEPIPCEITLTRAINKGSYLGLGYVYDLRNIKKMEKALSEAEMLTRTVTEASPISYILFDHDMRAVDCNDAAVKNFECSDKQFLLDNYWSRFSPQYQPDGRKSLEKAAAMRDYAFSNGRAIFEWGHLTEKGEQFPTENTLTRMAFSENDYFISFMYDLRRIKHLESEVEKIYFDSLTGIHNRRYFDENLDRLIKSFSRLGGTLSLMMIDIDYFKKYNDTYGHTEGDTCLKSVSELLSNSITRGNDFVARYGGEEFAVVLPSTDEKGVQLIAEKIIENVAQSRIEHSQSDVAPYVTISIGAVTGKVGPSHTSEYFIKKADNALYKSKQDGRNRYTLVQASGG